MPLAVLPLPFDHPDWLFEVKYDGFRAMAYIEHGRTSLVSREGNVYRSFDTLCHAICDSLQVRDAILDGEIVHLDAGGTPQFTSLLRRRSPQHFIAFDILWLDGKDLRDLCLIERKRILRSVVPVAPPIMYADYIDGNGMELYRAVCGMHLEGIGAKRKDGRYTPGDSNSYATTTGAAFSGRRNSAKGRLVLTLPVSPAGYHSEHLAMSLIARQVLC